MIQFMYREVLFAVLPCFSLFSFIVDRLYGVTVTVKKYDHAWVSFCDFESRNLLFFNGCRSNERKLS